MDWLALLLSEDSGSDSKQPLYVRLTASLKAAVQTGSLAPGTKLPTNRELANLLKLDRSTIGRAYAELIALGLIESHVGRGTFVRQTSPTPAAKQEASRASAQKFSWEDKFSRASSLTAELLGKQPTVNALANGFISFSGGSPAADSFPHDDFNTVLSELVAQSGAGEMFDYSPSEGDANLRKQLTSYLAKQHIYCQDDELLILSGSQQGIDLVASTFIDHGDAVVVEEPTYFWALCNFKARQARLLPVSLDDDGMRVEAVEAYCARFNPKLIYLMPDYQNPTGACLSLARRQRLLAIARHHGVPIFEDSFASELRYEGEAMPSLRSLPGGAEMVIHQGTFSKALCPGLRIGWLVAPREVIARLSMAKRACDLSTNSIAQVVLASYLAGGLYKEHLSRVKLLYSQRRDAMLRALQAHVGSLSLELAKAGRASAGSPKKLTWLRPSGGLFIWAKLPDGLSARELLKIALEEGVSFSPGDLFFPHEEAVPFFRLCFIQNDEEEIERGILRLSAAVKKLFESVQRLGVGGVHSGRNHESVLV